MVQNFKKHAYIRTVVLETIKQGQRPARLPVAAPERRVTHNANEL